MYSKETNTPLSSTSNKAIDDTSIPKPNRKIGFSITAMVCGIIAIGLYVLYIIYVCITGISLVTLLS